THTFPLVADKTKIIRLFFNLISNAQEAGTNDFQKIWIISRDLKIENSNYIEIELGNTGAVIPAEEIEHLFTKFYSKGKPSGSGLGLAICHNIVTSHGGTIRCHSSPEFGTIFIIRLPSK